MKVKKLRKLRTILLVLSLGVDISKVYTDVTHLKGYNKVASDKTISETAQAAALIIRTLLHVYMALWVASMIKYFITLKAERSSLSKFALFISALIFILILVRLFLHLFMNPLTAVLIMTDNVIPDDIVEAIFLIVRGFIVPLRDILEVSLICYMLRL